MTHWVDTLDFPKLVAQLTEFDERLRQFHNALRDQALPSDLILDDIDDLIGDGLHRCQRYMRCRIGPNPQAPRVGRDHRLSHALHCGPTVGARHVAEAIWQGANYWKHDGEWPLVFDESRLTERQQPTLRLFRDLGVTDSEYLLVRLMDVLAPGGRGFAHLADQLIRWRDAVDNDSACLGFDAANAHVHRRGNRPRCRRRAMPRI